MPASADDLTIAVTDGDVYWHVASLRVDGSPVSAERTIVFVNREPLVEDHWTYHQSGEIHHKRSGVADATREDQPLPLRSLVQFVYGQVLDLALYRERPRLQPGRRSVVLHADGLGTIAVLADVFLVPAGEETELDRAISLTAARPVLFVCRETDPWFVLAISGSHH